jgi:hypothetical protein
MTIWNRIRAAGGDGDAPAGGGNIDPEEDEGYVDDDEEDDNDEDDDEEDTLWAAPGHRFAALQHIVL